MSQRVSQWIKRVAAGIAFSCVGAAPTAAHAQTLTFYLDRLQVPGAPDDGMVLFRPVTQPDNIFYGQIGVGFQYAPLRTNNIVSDTATLKASKANVVDTQLTIYGSAGFELLNRAILSVNFPWNPWQTGQNPTYTSKFLTSGAPTTAVDTEGPTADDLRLDVRGVLWRTPNLRGAIGAQISLFVPTGTNVAFGGDGSVSGLFMLSAEYDFRPLVMTFNTGVWARPSHSLNDPYHNDGLGVSDEWRWALGAFLPFKDGKYRLGLNVFGSTGLHLGDKITGDTFFNINDTPLEWNVEGRMKFGGSEHWWAGLTAGSLIVPGYGAPDVRVFAALGAYVPLPGSEATQTDKDKRAAMREKWRSEHGEDSDGDGIPDDLDACPMEKEDHNGSEPNDGCPNLPDRDGDGIPDQFDKCPDQPEDKDGIDDGDGCPEDDADADGVPDTEDACPKQPGPRNTDPKKNGCPTTYIMEGSVIKFVQQVHFAVGSSTILPDSFQMLQEVANLIKVNPQIKRLAVEGHTDNTGAADMNRKLSQARAESVMKWLVDHGIDQKRLEAHGYGPDRPVDTTKTIEQANATAEMRTKNRRVEFKILEQADANQAQKK